MEGSVGGPSISANELALKANTTPRSEIDMTSVDKEQSDSEESALAPMQSSLWRRVNISLFVALLALLVSGLSSYFQFIHVD